eukprot:5115447-Pleurochrysis_carterae.AAC.1
MVQGTHAVHPRGAGLAGRSADCGSRPGALPGGGRRTRLGSGRRGNSRGGGDGGDQAGPGGHPRRRRLEARGGGLSDGAARLARCAGRTGRRRSGEGGARVPRGDGGRSEPGGPRRPRRAGATRSGCGRRRSTGLLLPGQAGAHAATGASAVRLLAGASDAVHRAGAGRRHAE